MNDEASGIFTRGFHNDPYLSWAEPNEGRRPRTLEAIFRAYVYMGSLGGGVIHQPGVSAIEWRRPEHADLSTLAIFTSGLWRVGLVSPPAVWYRLESHNAEAMRGVIPVLSKTSVYLSTFAVEPALAGKGHGGKALTAALATFAESWDTCVLRTDNPVNVPFYRKHGFTVLSENVMKASGLPVWVFSRPLR
jgi:GNAT superfamily N-acetyltransferase